MWSIQGNDDTPKQAFSNTLFRFYISFLLLAQEWSRCQSDVFIFLCRPSHQILTPQRVCSTVLFPSINSLKKTAFEHAELISTSWLPYHPLFSYEVMSCLCFFLGWRNTWTSISRNWGIYGIINRDIFWWDRAGDGGPLRWVVKWNKTHKTHCQPQQQTLYMCYI